MFGICKADVHKSVDYIISAVLNCKEMEIKFPSNHLQQLEIAQGFKSISRVGFSNCVGTIDGILIWLLKPTKKECDRAGVGSKKFFCARKHKFGLNLQAVCDSKKRFIDLSLKFPGSTSDFLAFQSSSLRLKLDEEGFLAPGLCLYGDNAYVNRPYMATPYPNVGEGSKDDYNFYHSQVRITIECAFGILVHRWGILRTPLSNNYKLDKVCKLVYCLCSLHNFLIDCRLEEEELVPLLQTDAFNLTLNGALTLEPRYREENGRQILVPEEVLGSGDHFDDDPGRARRIRASNQLPRERMHRLVIENNYRRPGI